MNISEFSEYLMNILRTNIENFVDEWSKIDNKIDHIQVKKLFESFDFIIDNFQQMFGVNLKIRFEHYEHIDIK